MATIRKHFGKWQVMIRRKGYPHVSKTFTEKSLASTWAKQTELDMERQTYNDVTLASRTTLREVLLKYRDEGITHLKSARTITSKINIILKDKIADYGLTQLRSKHAWEFKKRISDGRKPKTINMYIDTLNSVWKYARTNLSIAVPAEAPASLVAKSMLPDTFTDGKVADWCDAVIATHKTYKINGAGAVKFKYPPKEVKILTDLEKRFAELFVENYFSQDSKTNTEIAKLSGYAPDSAYQRGYENFTFIKRCRATIQNK